MKRPMWQRRRHPARGGLRELRGPRARPTPQGDPCVLEGAVFGGHRLHAPVLLARGRRRSAPRRLVHHDRLPRQAAIELDDARILGLRDRRAHQASRAGTSRACLISRRMMPSASTAPHRSLLLGGITILVVPHRAKPEMSRRAGTRSRPRTAARTAPRRYRPHPPARRGSDRDPGRSPRCRTPRRRSSSRPVRTTRT